MRKLVVALSMIGLFSVSVPSAASGTTVTLKVSLGKPSAPYVTKTSCSVAVPAGANGIAVLDAAVAKGCITSYNLTTYGNGRFVSCVDHICGTLATYWAMRENGAYTDYGVDGFIAAAGDELWFAYEEWITCYGIGLAC